MLGAQYAASQTLKGLKCLIISNSPALMDLFEAGMNALLDEFPADVVQKIRKHEADGTTPEQEYQSFMMTFYGKHICNMGPMPEVLANSLKTMESKPTVYRTMLVLSQPSISTTLTLAIGRVLLSLRSLACWGVGLLSTFCTTSPVWLCFLVHHLTKFSNLLSFHSLWKSQKLNGLNFKTAHTLPVMMNPRSEFIFK